MKFLNSLRVLSTAMNPGQISTTTPLVLISLVLSWGLGDRAQAGIMDDFDKLGGNDVLMEKAKALEPESKISIVQNRTVDRTHRFEISPEFASVLGGDSYLSTNSYGVNVNFHLNPHWSFGVKYNSMTNKLSPEGQNLISDSSILGKSIVPDLDYAKDETLGLVTFYPIYGKLNVFDQGIAQFDVYFLGGYGNINLKSGLAKTMTGGGGVGFWFSQHLTTRLEMRYQTYDSQRANGSSKMQLTIASLQMGYLL